MELGMLTCMKHPSLSSFCQSLVLAALCQCLVEACGAAHAVGESAELYMHSLHCMSCMLLLIVFMLGRF